MFQQHTPSVVAQHCADCRGTGTQGLALCLIGGINDVRHIVYGHAREQAVCRQLQKAGQIHPGHGHGCRQAQELDRKGYCRKQQNLLSGKTPADTLQKRHSRKLRRRAYRYRQTQLRLRSPGPAHDGIHIRDGHHMGGIEQDAGCKKPAELRISAQQRRTA